MGDKHCRPPETDSRRAESTPENPAELTRRKLLQGAAVFLGMGVSPLGGTTPVDSQQRPVRGRKQWPKPTPGRRNPRFRRRKNKDNACQTNLAPGFYLNPKSQVIHYVRTDRKIARVYRINERRLSSLKTTELVNLLLGNNKPRVSLATASHVLEHAALGSLNAGQHSLACQLLLTAIRHDQYFKQGVREESSLRLYDMLAGVASRFGQQKSYDEALRLARIAQQRLSQSPVRRRTKAAGRRRQVAPPKASHPPRAHRRLKKARKLNMKAARETRVRRTIETRLSKWTAADSSWKRLWRDLNKPLPWKSKAR